MADRRRRAPRTTNAFVEIRARLIAGGGVTSEKMVAVILKERKEILRDEALEIQHAGLMRLASEVNSRKSGPMTSAQLDLFSEYAAAPKCVVVRVPDDKGIIQPVHKPVDSLTLREAKQYLAEHMTPRPKHSDEIEDFARMVTELSKYGKEDWTLAQCFKAMKERRRRFRS